MRRLFLFAVLALSLGSAAVVSAQGPPPETIVVSDTIQGGGTVSGSGTDGSGNLLPISATYTATLNYQATVNISLTSLLPPGGSFSVSGTFSGNVQSDDFAPVTVSGGFAGSGQFTESTFSTSGTFTLDAPVGGGGSYSAGGTYTPTGSVSVSGTYTASAENTPVGPVSVGGDFSSNTTISIPSVAMPSDEAVADVRAAQFATPSGALGRVVPLVVMNPAVGLAVASDATGASADGLTFLPLSDGWNLVGWTGQDLAPTAEVVEPLGDALVQLLTWNPTTQGFLRYTPGGPSALNTASTLAAGGGIWLFMAGADQVWPAAALDAPMALPLEAGFNLVTWTGADGVAPADAVAALGDAFRSLFAWDAAGGRYLTYRASVPSALNTLTTLTFGQGVWIDVAEGVTWDQGAAP